MAISCGGGYVGAVVVGVVLALFLGNGMGEMMSRADGADHVVGDDHGWDISSDIAAWAIDKVFRVGDNIWFAYAGEEEGIVELQRKEELDSCNLSKPMKMYTSGVDRVTLDDEGARYFASIKPEKCRKGLKLHVEVMPKGAMVVQPGKTMIFSDHQVAQGPQPSASYHLKASHLMPFMLAILVLSIC